MIPVLAVDEDKRHEESLPFEDTQGCYKVFYPLIKLHGRSYDPIKKAVFYNLIGSVLWKNPIHCGDIYTDSRVNLFIPLKSGHGKREIKTVIKRSAESIGQVYCEPTSLHPEQLVGKTVIRGSGKNPLVKLNHGHLNDDYLVFEEAIELFTDEKYREARSYIRIALDPIGENQVYKRSVDALRGEDLRYCPHCTMTFFFQPLPLTADLVTRGLLRRGLIVFIHVAEAERIQSLSRVMSEVDREENWHTWTSILKVLGEKRFRWRFSKETKQEIVKLSRRLIEYGYSKNGKSMSYTQIMFHTLQNLLVKLSCLVAAVQGREEVTSNDAAEAFRDLLLFWKSQIEFIEQKIQGSIDYSALSNLDHKATAYLCTLLEKGCISEKTSYLMIKEFVKLMSDKLRISVRTAQHHYYILKNQALIDSKQTGRYKSKVWLTDSGRLKALENGFSPPPVASLDTLDTLDNHDTSKKTKSRKTRTSDNLTLDKDSLDAVRRKTEYLLRTMYGFLNVFNLRLLRILPREDVLEVKGTFSEDYGGRKQHRFEAEIDTDYRVKRIEAE